ncbi:retropepsin-like aspartic protease family protein [Anabaena catenula]|uniref:Retroviral-like aspartic protease family protein n=1 Tax=Anabaena catenula FACHB-362 TaxID=2692877 RepID=A0ABR8J3P8_9NOST|nr:retropepsin-like aspartic protease [Anabaena catenula]MBD2692195.1 retroviral-like aspartic protease family protein [Anabaena catenula FACHB-362]
MKAVERIGIASIFGMMFLTVPYVAKANDPGACFMVTSSGKTVSLGQLCGVNQLNQPSPRVFRVPIKRRSGRTPIIDVNFNGNQVFEMIVDTGASGILITQGMATALKVQPSGKISAMIADGSVVEFQTGKMPTIAVSGAVVNNATVAIAPKARIGLLGHDFFGNYDVKILEKQVEFQQR